MSSCWTIDESILDASKTFDQREADEWIASEYTDVEEKSAPLLLDSVKKSAAAVTGSEGLKKLNECIAGLNTSTVFNRNVQPKNIADDGKLLEYLGFSGENFIFSKRESILLGWRTYCDEWEAPAEPLSPAGNHAQWASQAANAELEDTVRDICAHAAKMCMRPISASCCERIFSFLEKMDGADRSSMKKDTLAKLLFINGNSHIIEDIVKTSSAKRIAAPVQARHELQRQRAAASFKAAASAAGAGGGAAKRPRIC